MYYTIFCEVWGREFELEFEFEGEFEGESSRDP
jgi:hypothetical protein